MPPSIAVLAAGALGAPVAGELSANGHDVVLVDPWVEHVEAVRASGLRITTGPWDDPESQVVVPVSTLHLYELAAARPSFDVVFLTSKAYDSAWLAQFVVPYLKDDGYVVCMQNSLTEEWVEPIVGPGRVVGAILSAGGGELVAPGDTWRDHLDNAYLLGELDGSVTPRIEELAAIVDDTAKTAITTNYWGSTWTKLAQTTMAAAFSGITGGRTREIMLDPRGQRIAHALGLEVFAVADAVGQKLAPLDPDMDIDGAHDQPELILPSRSSAKAPGREAHNFIYQDLMKGRKTEIDYINGLVCKKGDENGVPTPVNRQAVDLVHRVERGELTSDPANLSLIEL
jgi:2-dehydropantoate 2-reductase